MVIETTTFRLADGVDADAFVDIDARFQTGFAYQQRGLVSRTVACGDNGAWLALTMWGTPDDADAAHTALETAPPDVASAWSACVDQGSLATTSYTTI